MVVLDTNIIIDHVRRPGNEATLLVRVTREIARENLAISIVSIQELFAGKSTAGKESQMYLTTVIAPLQMLAYTKEVAQRAGQIMRDAPRPIGFADSAIAATAILSEASLFTLNQKDFEDIEGLELLRL